MSQSKRKVISLELKLDIIKRFKSGEKAVNIGRALGLAPTTVRTICNRDSNKINKLAEFVTPLQSKQDTMTRNPLLFKMEYLLSVWIHDQNKRRMPLSKEVIKNKALSIYTDLKKNTASSSNGNSNDFIASNGWFNRFKTRANLHNVTLKEEPAIEDSVAAEKFKLDEELDNENLFAIDIQDVSEEDVIISDDDTLEEKKLTIANISKAMQLISHAMDIFSENDPDENRSASVAASVDQAISCYKEIYQTNL